MKSSYARRARRKSSSQGRTFFRSATSPQPAFFSPAEALVQKKCESCAHGEKADASPKGAAAFIQKLPGRGEPLPPVVSEFFSSRMGADFSSVRVHRDAEAAQSASALHAQAYTVGNDIVFNRGKFAPGTDEGRTLLSHELVHVLQQRSQPARSLQKMPEQGEPGVGEKEKKPAAEPAEEPVTASSKAKEDAALTEGEKLAQPMALPDFTTFGKLSVHTDFAKSVTFNGKTEGTFDGGVGQTKNLKGVPGKDCSGCDAAECVHVTGSLVITYHVSTTVMLPDVPAGLTPCQEKRVRDAINNKIKPHEDQHVSAFGTYNGAVTLPINFNGCKADLAAHVQAMHDAHAIARENAARAKSAALDPFHVSVNLDCEDEPPKK